MDYLKEYRSFISSHYLSEGVRITAAILLPVLIWSYLGNLPVGMTMALGALSASIPDNPGPIHHRKNGLIVCTIVIFFVSIITSLTAPIHTLFFFCAHRLLFHFFHDRRIRCKGRLYWCCCFVGDGVANRTSGKRMGYLIR